MPYKDIEKQRAAQRRYVEQNKEKVVAAQNTKRSLMRRYLQEVKSVPCADCDISYPYYVMQFDHMPGHEKSFTISRLNYIGSMERLKEEIAKCEVVCANCHAHRSFMRLGAYPIGQESHC